MPVTKRAISRFGLPLFLLACNDPVLADSVWNVSIEFPSGAHIEYAVARNHRLAFKYSEWSDEDDLERYKQYWRSTGLRYSYLMGTGSHYSEFALAVDMAKEKVRFADTRRELRGWEYSNAVYAGYRYEPHDSGFQFRAGFVRWRVFKEKDAYEDTEWFQDFTWPYLSLGWAF